MLWECSTYLYSNRADFLLKLLEKLENGFECFDALDRLRKSAFILGSTAKFHSSYIGMNIVCGSAYENGCMVLLCKVLSLVVDSCNLI